MVKSDLCWMKDSDKRDCDFDHGGYFLIKGAEKVSLENFGFCILFYHDCILLCWFSCKS